MIYLPLNSSISTTGHKLEGKTLQNLIVNSWAYHCPQWIYVVLSRVTSLKGLILNEKSDDTKTYEVNSQLLRWEKMTKQTIENRNIRDRGDSDYKPFLLEEQNYNPTNEYTYIYKL